MVIVYDTLELNKQILNNVSVSC